MVTPATFNDITLSRDDTLLRDIQNGSKYSDYVFQLYEYGPTGEINTVNYKGVWLIGDNGYDSDWTCIQFPIKDPLTMIESRYSKWLESLRKDIECTFG